MNKNMNTWLIEKILKRAEEQDIPSKDIEVLRKVLTDNERISLSRLYHENDDKFVSDLVNLEMFYSLKEHCMTGYESYLQCKRVPIAE